MRKYLYIIVAMLVLLPLKAGRAFPFPDFTPRMLVAPQFCPMCPPAMIKQVTTAYEELSGVKDAYSGKQLVTSVMQGSKGYLVTLGKSRFNYLGQKITSRRKVVSASRTIEDCTIAGNISDEGKVKDAFVELFLQYPSNKTKTKKAYAENAAQFQIDTSLEMYLTAQEMSKEIDVMLVELENIEKCLVAGEDCSSEGLEAYNCQQEGKEDEVCLWRNSLNAARIYDRIMRYNEYLTAMNAQYNAVKNIGSLVKVREYKDESKKEIHGSNNINIMQKSESKMAYLSTTETVAYASKSSDERFESLSDAGIVSPVAGKEAEFESMEIISEAQKRINDAISAHNYKQNLPEYLSMFNTYHEMQDQHKRAMENVSVSGKCIENYLGGRYKNAGSAWIGSGCYKRGSEYVCHYSEPKKKDDNSDSIGQYDVPCSNNSEEKCYVISENDYNNRSGISGWLLSLVEESRKTEATDDEDIYITLESHIEDVELKSVDKMKSDNKKKYENDKNGNKEALLKRPSTEKDMYAESRKNSIINWTIGARVAREIYADSILLNPKFGAGTSKITLWNDQKTFYDLYLKGKYDNIRKYIETAPLLGDSTNELNKLLQHSIAGVSPAEKAEPAFAELTQAMKNGIASLPKLFEQQENEKKQISGLLAQEDGALKALTDKYNKSRSELLNLQKSTYRKMDDLSGKLDSLNNNINEEHQVVDTSETENPFAQEAIEYGKTLQRDNTVSPQNSTFSKNIKDNDSSKDKSKLLLDGMKVESATLDKEIRKLRADIENIDEKLTLLESEYILQYAILEEAYQNEIAAAVTKQKESVVSKQIKGVMSNNSAIEIANKLTDLIRAYLLAELDETVAEIGKLQTSNLAYYPQNGAKIVKIHNEFLDKVRNVTLEGLISNAVNGEAIAKLLKDIPLLKDLVEPIGERLAIVAKDKEIEDKDYFVSISAGERDFQAPKSAVNFASAPMREIFHFDAEDYSLVARYTAGGADNIPQSNKDITLSKISLLNSGLDIPEIWKYILRRHAFVERDIDLAELLNGKGNPSQTLTYSGIYPCRTASGEVVLGKTRNGLNYAKNIAGADSKYIKQMCTTVEISNGTAKDIESGAEVTMGGDVSAYTSQSSELGQILDYIPTNMSIKIGDKKVSMHQKLTFRQELQTAVYNISNSQNIGESNNPGSEDIKYYMSNRILFSQNMFGDYIDNIDIERVSAETLAEFEIQIKDVQETIRGIFENLGYSLSDDFDLSKVDDYNMAMRVLDEHKNLSMERAKDLISQINGNTDYIKGKKQELLHSIKVLEKDKDEVTTVGPNDDLAELEEKIKTSQANKDVVSVYETEGSKAFKQNIKRVRPPYCPVYPL